ncbi:hypothetical protein HY230_10475 [Candidatus Acetothermia bacterium]|nr:hypothetical protein [Candidatus Acetothermia bacterium]
MPHLPFAPKEFKVKGVTFLEEPGLIEPAESDQSQTPAILPIQFLQELEVNDGWLFRAVGALSALRLGLIDLSGRTIYDSGFVNGESLSWARVNRWNKRIARGVYLYRLTARDREGKEIQSEVKKLVIRR